MFSYQQHILSVLFGRTKQQNSAYLTSKVHLYIYKFWPSPYYFPGIWIHLETTGSKRYLYVISSHVKNTFCKDKVLNHFLLTIYWIMTEGIIYINIVRESWPICTPPGSKIAPQRNFNINHTYAFSWYFSAMQDLKANSLTRSIYLISKLWTQTILFKT